MAKEVRDPIHGLVVFEPQEWKVIDSRPFQRLRGIEQLAMTHLVYPGARHSRFEHCMGAGHVAGKLAKSLDLDAMRRGKVRLAALVHDIGHGPFSHVSEEIFEARTGRKHVHEAVSAAIVRHHAPIGDAMGDDTANWVAELLSGQGHGSRRSVERDIVAGPSDVDKLDYLLRDSHFCGVKYGEYDLAKVVESAREIMDPLAADTFLGFSIEGTYALEEMLLARYHMHRQVYGHRTRVATDRMLVRSMESAIATNLLPSEIFTPPEEPDAIFVEEYISWDDNRVRQVICDSPDTPAGKVMTALIERRLFKRVDEYDFPKLNATFGQPGAGYIAQPDDAALRKALPEAEAIVATALGIEPYWVSLHWQHIVSPISGRFSFKVEGSRILIADEEGKHQTFDQASEVFGDTELPGQIRISLYAKLEDGQSSKDLPKERMTRIRDAFKEALAMVGRAAAQA